MRAGLKRNPKAKEDLDTDEREDVQKKTFGKWINSMLARGNQTPISDMFYDLRDGTKLLSLLETLTNKTYKRERGRMRVHHLNNVSRALDVLKEQKVRLVNISNNDIVDGNPITLALSWTIFLHWQVNDIMKELMQTMNQSNLEKALLLWCQQNTEPYPGVAIRNFTTAWSDGLAFAALIHRWRPDVIDFGSSAAKPDPNERLEVAFKTAHEIFGIEKLLDPEDVNNPMPDKKSVMMYVMCLFQALAQSGIEPPPLPSKEGLQEAIATAKLEEEASRGPTVELASYQNIVEEVLSRLLIEDDRITTMTPVSENLDVVKGQFQEHEKFMLSLTEHQGDVGEVLQEGSRLLQEAKLPAHEMEEVRVQVKLLNTKWEDLRVKAMDRQTKIHEKLMSLQLSELEALKEFLTSTEDRVSRMGPIALHDLSIIEDQLKEQKQLQEDIITQEGRVAAFSNLVVVVDENSSEADFSNMEDQLAALSERWSHICTWTEKRGKLISQLKLAVPIYLQKHKDLEEWLKSEEKKLKEVEANPTDSSDDSLMERYEKLQYLQAEMEAKMQDIDKLQNDVQKLVDEANSPNSNGKEPLLAPVKREDADEQSVIATTKFMEEIEGLHDRWDAISQILEAQSQRMSKYGINTNPNKHGVDFVDIVAISRQQDFPRAKKTKIMNNWQTSHTRVNEWLQRTENLVECTQGNTCTFDELSVDEQLILWEDLESELVSNEDVYKKAIEDSNSLINVMRLENQDTTEVEDQADRLSRKWEAIENALTDRKLLIDFLLAKKQLHNETTSMLNILSAYEKWLDGQGEVSPISNEGRKLLEQCRVKNKTILSHETRANKFAA